MHSSLRQHIYGITKTKQEIMDKIMESLGTRIIGLFKNGMEQQEIGKMLIEKEEGFSGYSVEMVRSAICSYLVENMDPEERKTISQLHIETSSRNRMLSLGKAERTERAKLGGQAAKDITSRETYQERGKNGVLAQGNVPFSDKEIIYLAILLKDSHYHLQTGPNAGCPNYQIVAELLNTTFHDTQSIREKSRLQKRVNKPQNKKKLEQIWEQGNKSDF